MFTGFPEETLRFFLDIRFHNDAAYYNANRDRFEQDVKAPFYAFIEALAPVMREIDPMMEVRPYKCLARLRRDTRFSKDKTPYRDRLWLLFRRQAEPRLASVMYWFELSLDQVDWGVGTWGENRPMMDIIRRRIAAKPDEVREIIRSCELEKHDLILSGDVFKRLEVPPGVPEELRPWYMMRTPYVSPRHTELIWAKDASILDRVREDFVTLAPVYRMLRGAYDDTL